MKARASRSRTALIRRQYNDELIADRYKLTANRIIENAWNVIKCLIREQYKNNLQYPAETMTEAELNQMKMANQKFKNQVIMKPAPVKEFTYC